jgi:hypothetical protein
MADLGLAYTPRPDHAAYLASWLGALRHDPKAIFNAAAQRRPPPTGSTRRTSCDCAAGDCCMRRATAPARLWPDGAQAACRPLSGIPPAEWLQAYSHGGGDPHRHGSRDAILRPSTAGAGRRRVLLRNPYADIGLTCFDGQAAVWIGERIDRDYRIRCEWSDVSGRPVTGSPASRRLSRPAPSALALSPSTHPSISLGSKPPDRVPSGDPYVPTAYLWRMARRQPWPHHC